MRATEHRLCDRPQAPLAGRGPRVIACFRTFGVPALTSASTAPSPEKPPSTSQGAGRFAWIDWFRGLACILMFQTHAYDAWTREPFRQGLYWDIARMQLGGFPARMFLFLAGVSLMLRYSGDARRGVSPQDARRGALWRGCEVLLYGLLFRVAEWLLGGAERKNLPELFKVDILNCIGVSLMICALLVPPRPRGRSPVPIVALISAVAVVFAAPVVQRWPWPAWLPASVAAYLWDGTPLGTFPQLPFLAYTLSGAVFGSVWLKAASDQRLAKALMWSSILGLFLALAIQWGNWRGYALFSPSPTVPIPAFPSSFGYRLGMCLLLAGGSYAWTTWRGSTQFSPLRILGQASLLVYVVHVEMVYGRLTWSLHHRLHPLTVTALIGLLSGLMIALAWFRVERFGPWLRTIRGRSSTLDSVRPATEK